MSSKRKSKPQVEIPKPQNPVWSGADPGEGGGGRDPPPPALDHQFFFSTNFLTICEWRHTGNVQGGVLVNAQEWGYFSIFLRVG